MNSTFYNQGVEDVFCKYAIVGRLATTGLTAGNYVHLGEPNKERYLPSTSILRNAGNRALTGMDVSLMSTIWGAEFGVPEIAVPLATAIGAVEGAGEGLYNKYQAGHDPEGWRKRQQRGLQRYAKKVDKYKTGLVSKENDVLADIHGAKFKRHSDKALRKANKRYSKIKKRQERAALL